jgi:hypothetical protein
MDLLEVKVSLYEFTDKKGKSGCVRLGEVPRFPISNGGRGETKGVGTTEARDHCSGGRRSLGRTFDAQMGRNGPLFFFGGCRSNSLDLHHWWVWRSSGLFATPGELAFWQPRVSSIKTP